MAKVVDLSKSVCYIYIHKQRRISTSRNSLSGGNLLHESGLLIFGTKGSFDATMMAVSKEKSNMTESDGRDRKNTENRSERRPILWYNTQYSDR